MQLGTRLAVLAACAFALLGNGCRSVEEPPPISYKAYSGPGLPNDQIAYLNARCMWREERHVYYGLHIYAVDGTIRFFEEHPCGVKAELSPGFHVVDVVVQEKKSVWERSFAVGFIAESGHEYDFSKLDTKFGLIWGVKDLQTGDRVFPRPIEPAPWWTDDFDPGWGLELEFLEQLAREGHAGATYLLALTKDDVTQRKRLLCIAAQSGYAGAAFQLAFIYDQSQSTLDRLSRTDPDFAANWIRIADFLGSPYAQYVRYRYDPNWRDFEFYGLEKVEEAMSELNSWDCSNLP